MRGRILIVDDEPLKRIALQIELSEAGFEAVEAQDVSSARRLLDMSKFHVVLADPRVPNPHGPGLLTFVRQTRPGVPVIFMSANPTVDSVVQALRSGAADFLGKPFTTAELIIRIERLLTGNSLMDAAAPLAQFGHMTSVSPAMQRVFEQATAAASDARPVLISGEPGVGKSLLARSIHEHRRTPDAPFVLCSCRGCDPGTLERELFGQQRGVESGRARPGRIEAAAGGSICLAAIDELSIDVQARLARLIAEQAEGGPTATDPAERPFRVARGSPRWIATTSRDLARLVREGRFREDLLTRLNVLAIRIPPLRERPGDIALLARRFIALHGPHVRRGDDPAQASLAAESRGTDIVLSAAALDELMRYNWPGNIRQLDHVIERALVFCGAGEIRPEHVLPLADAPDSEALPPVGDDGRLGLAETLAGVEKRMILLALRKCAGNQARAAAQLGIPRTTLRDKMGKYDIRGD